jgi:hypothetical protein
MMKRRGCWRCSDPGYTEMMKKRGCWRYSNPGEMRMLERPRSRGERCGSTKDAKMLENQKKSPWGNEDEHQRSGAYTMEDYPSVVPLLEEQIIRAENIPIRTVSGQETVGSPQVFDYVSGPQRDHRKGVTLPQGNGGIREASPLSQAKYVSGVAAAAGGAIGTTDALEPLGQNAIVGGFKDAMAEIRNP